MKGLAGMQEVILCCTALSRAGRRCNESYCLILFHLFFYFAGKKTKGSLCLILFEMHFLIDQSIIWLVCNEKAEYNL